MKPEISIDRLGPEDADTLVGVWEASARATHHFLSEADYEFLKPLVLPGLLGLQQLFGARTADGKLVGFVGVDDDKMEALFVHPDWFRTGVGRLLADHAVTQLGARTVDVNEQNEQALSFYLHLGFRQYGRSEVDGQGKPFPLIHLRLDDSTAG